MQMNNKEAKNFRNALALWHIADFKKADADITRNKFVAAMTTMISTDEERLKKLANGDTTIGNKSDIEKEITAYKLKVEAERTRVKKLKEEFDKDSKKGLDLITAELQSALEAYVSDCYNSATESALRDQLVKWFTDNGCKDVTADDVTIFMRPLGVKKASARVKCKESVHMTADKKRSLSETFLGIVCDEPSVKKLLPIHKWENVIEDKTRKK